MLTSLKNDEERLRKLINFVKPFELPEIKPPPEKRAVRDEDIPPLKKPNLETPSSTGQIEDTSSRINVDDQVRDTGLKQMFLYFQFKDGFDHEINLICVLNIHGEN